MNRSYDLKVGLRAETACPQLAPDVHLLLFRTVRELLFNVVKHAGVEQARVVLACEPGEGTRPTIGVPIDTDPDIDSDTESDTDMPSQ